MSELKEDIDTFFKYFYSLHSGISETKHAFADPICKSILFCSILDSLSKCVYGDTNRNRERFTSFVDDFSDWEFRDKISLIQLQLFLEKETDLKYEKTKSFLTQHLHRIKKGGFIYRASDDLTLSEIPHTKIVKDEIEQFSYSNLLYKYRNSVVHEFKTPGSGTDMGDMNEVHYYHLSRFDYSDKEGVLLKQTWELVFPIKYLSKIVLKSISNLHSYCEKNQINPFNKYYFDVRWLTSTEVKRKKN